MNLKSLFENLDAVIESVCKGIDSVTKDLGKMEDDFVEDAKRRNSKHQSEAKKHKQNIDKIFGSKKPKLF